MNTNQLPPLAPGYHVDTLTGKTNIFEPWKHIHTADDLRNKSLGRPLPTILKATGPENCALCGQRPDDTTTAQGMIVRRNEIPLQPEHYLILPSRHIVEPRHLTVDQWESYFTLVHATRQATFARTGKRLLVYGNLGTHAGGSEEHFHVQLLESPATPATNHHENTACPVCTTPRPLIHAVHEIRTDFIPGGRSGEVIIHPQQCMQLSETNNRHLAESAHLAARAFGAVWDSLTLSHHETNTGHGYIRMSPTVSALGALEAQFGVTVGRLHPDHVRLLYRDANRKQ